MAEIEITIRVIIVLSSPAADHIKSARIRLARAADLVLSSLRHGGIAVPSHFPKHPRPVFAEGFLRWKFAGDGARAPAAGPLPAPPPP